MRNENLNPCMGGMARVLEKRGSRLLASVFVAWDPRLLAPLLAPTSSRFQKAAFCIVAFFLLDSPRDAHLSVHTSWLSAPSHAHAFALFNRPTKTYVVLAGACGRERQTHVIPNLEVDPALRAKGKKRDTYRVVDRQTSGFLEVLLFAGWSMDK